jgi:predicted site-specific integrase-resolvase
MSERLTMNRKQFAERVGISVRTLDSLLAEGKVSCSRIASRVLFTEAHAEELLKKFEVRAREPKGRLRVVNG